MRGVFLAVIFATGSIAFAQSSSQAPVFPGFPGEHSRSGYTGQDVYHSPFPLNPLLGVRPGPMNPPPWGALLRNDSPIDPGILLHPQAKDLGAQPPGTLVAQNQFPGLTLLPIDGKVAVIAPISTTWPQLRLEPIPTICSQGRVLLLETTAAPGGTSQK
jgi:hypothetical protein